MSRKILSFVEAVKLLPEGDTVHTFYNLPNMLVGADWSIAEVLKKLGEEGVRIELTGGKAKETGHGMCVHPNKGTYYQSEILFIETDPEMLKKVEADG